MARPYWSGQIQISLVSFGVKLFTATETKSEIRFHQISRSTGERIRHPRGGWRLTLANYSAALDRKPGPRAGRRRTWLVSGGMGS